MAAKGERMNAFERMVMDGMLDESDAYEVAETIELLAERYAQGDITERFANTVLKKLADEARAKYLRRTWGGTDVKELDEVDFISAFAGALHD